MLDALIVCLFICLTRRITNDTTLTVVKAAQRRGPESSLLLCLMKTRR
jgi:hypothetical protein